MSTTPERLVRCREAARELGVSTAYFSAVRRAMGLRGHFVFLSLVRKFLKTHPTFRMADVYHPPTCTCPDCVAKRARQAERKQRTAVGAGLAQQRNGGLATAPPAQTKSLEPAQPTPPPAVHEPEPVISETDTDPVTSPVKPFRGTSPRRDKPGHSHLACAMLELMEQHQISGKEITRRSAQTDHRFPSSYLSRILSGPQVYVGKAHLTGLARVLTCNPREHFTLCRARLLDECPEAYQSQLQILCPLDLPEKEAAYPLVRLSPWGRAAVRTCIMHQPAAFEQFLEALTASLAAPKADLPVRHFARALEGFMTQHRVTGKEVTKRTQAAGCRQPSSWLSRVTSATQTWIAPQKLTVLVQSVTPDPVEQAELVRAHLYDECPPFAFPLVRVVLAQEDRSDEALLQRLSLRGQAALRRILEQAADPEQTFVGLVQHAGLN